MNALCHAASCVQHRRVHDIYELLQRLPCLARLVAVALIDDQHARIVLLSGGHFEHTL